MQPTRLPPLGSVVVAEMLSDFTLTGNAVESPIDEETSHFVLFTTYGTWERFEADYNAQEEKAAGNAPAV